MRVETNGKVFEFLVDGKPTPEADFLEVFTALGSAYFPIAVVAQGKDGPEAAIRAITFAADEEYAEQLVNCMESKLAKGEELGIILLDTSEDDSEDDDKDTDEV